MTGVRGSEVRIISTGEAMVFLHSPTLPSSRCVNHLILGLGVPHTACQRHVPWVVPLVISARLIPESISIHSGGKAPRVAPACCQFFVVHQQEIREWTATDFVLFCRFIGKGTFGNIPIANSPQRCSGKYFDHSNAPKITRLVIPELTNWESHFLLTMNCGGFLLIFPV